MANSENEGFLHMLIVLLELDKRVKSDLSWLHIPDEDVARDSRICLIQSHLEKEERFELFKVRKFYILQFSKP